MYYLDQHFALGCNDLLSLLLLAAQKKYVFNNPDWLIMP
jgi:hypothetical protein